MGISLAYCRDGGGISGRLKTWWCHQRETVVMHVVRRVHQSSLNSPHKGQWHGALMFSVICARMNGWVNNREAGTPLRSLWCHCNDINKYNSHVFETLRDLMVRHLMWYWNGSQKIDPSKKISEKDSRRVFILAPGFFHNPKPFVHSQIPVHHTGTDRYNLLISFNEQVPNDFGLLKLWF